MQSNTSAPKSFSTARVVAFVFAASVFLAVTGSASAQTSTPASEPAKPGAVSKVKTKSKETWADMKARWAKQKDRWADCQKREKAEKRSATATRVFLDDCMTKQ